MENWWSVWESECQRVLDTYDLGWAPILDGRTAVACWEEDGVPRVIIDRPIAEAMVDRDAGFMLRPWIQEAVCRYREEGGVVTVPLPRRWRRIRQEWLKSQGVAS